MPNRFHVNSEWQKNPEICTLWWIFQSYITTVWILRKFTLTHFWQKIRESNGFTKEVTREMISRNFFQWEWIFRFSTVWKFVSRFVCHSDLGSQTCHFDIFSDEEIRSTQETIRESIKEDIYCYTVWKNEKFTLTETFFVKSALL